MAQQPIFLMVAGLSPQVVTETLYAFHRESSTSLVGAELHLITTLEGAQRAELTLLTGANARLPKLIADYGLPDIRFSTTHLHIIPDSQGRPLEDIRTPDDNAAAANFITQRVRDFTSRPDTALHVSLAGGRKTMGFYIGYALSLYGREQDTLSHVLVSERFESHPEFFYPTPESQVIYTRDGKPLDTRRAEVTLARIPFVRLRDELPQEALVQQLSFSDAVALLNAATQPAQLRVSVSTPRLICNGISVTLEPMEWMLYLWFVHRCQQRAEPLTPPVEGHPDRALANEMLGVIRHFDLEDRLSPRSLAALEDGLDLGPLRTRRSTLHRKLKLGLGRRLAEPFMIANVRHQRHSGWALTLCPEQITLTHHPLDGPLDSSPTPHVSQGGAT
ncbi:TIGR02584 family CRISPR-associated protein [Halomonas campisalis]|uniref:TIGR02584 family CRISPR-associated protein n=1 Tax=Billgrantia campisalis TaxID=74661 RepID=A0ABS9PD71_9GAMM|nr:CRISPR-associated ring nuclease Csm6 [Halomonas campisalis]MCG6659399.1 TIGR02584 family CRISPR-associated protein [Halomonas campisalis]MDR5864001.1 CRISPR-associated ring nuclease Csm6 [Halomonas campisalis]